MAKISDLLKITSHRPYLLPDISGNSSTGSKMHVEFKVGNIISAKSDLDKWLTERYCLFLEENGNIFRYDIHHTE